MDHGTEMSWGDRFVRVNSSGALFLGSSWASRRNADYDDLYLSYESKDPLRLHYMSRL